MNTLRVAPYPSVQTLRENVAIPSAVFASDHLSVIVDLAIKAAELDSII
jgi:hypothetical protein